jgi:hypothetical protein
VHLRPKPGLQIKGLRIPAKLYTVRSIYILPGKMSYVLALELGALELDGRAKLKSQGKAKAVLHSLKIRNPCLHALGRHQRLPHASNRPTPAGGEVEVYGWLGRFAPPSTVCYRAFFSECGFYGRRIMDAVYISVSAP